VKCTFIERNSSKCHSIESHSTLWHSAECHSAKFHFSKCVSCMYCSAKRQKKSCNRGPSGRYYKHVTMVNYASSGVNKLRASLNDNARVFIYDRHMFIVQAPGSVFTTLYFLCD
jgi:hypothetical protein